jgi:hypothetical protein
MGLMITAISLEFDYAVATRNVAHFKFSGLAGVNSASCMRRLRLDSAR